MATTVRRAPSGGLNVRSTAAGTKVVTLNEGDLMYEISGVSKVTKSLNGTSYEWVKVHYYHSSTKPATEGNGWVTTQHATVISTTTPSMSDTLFSNSYLKQHEMLTNARYVYNYLKNKGWSSNAIYGMLGNMESESTINPGVWYNLKSTDPTKAYGIVQWNPSTNLTKWLKAENKSDTIANQLKRILYEVENDEQWQSSKHSPIIDFKEFTTSTDTCSVLAEYFLRCYEKPGDESSKVSERQSNANKWAKLIGYLK